MSFSPTTAGKENAHLCRNASIMETNLSQQAGQALSEMATIFSMFPEKDVNTVPFAGSWTPAQVVQHILLSVDGCAALLTGPTDATQRNPEEHVQQLRDLFLNFEIKFQAAPDITPEDKEYDKTALSQQLDDLRRNLETAISSHDLTRTCTTFEFPTIGYLTGIEVVNFAAVHTQRHSHQLKNIFRVMEQA
jgi:hypothetical protein